MLNKLKMNKWKLLLSSVLILLPILAGVILWDRLPETMTTHWGADGNADGYMSRTLAVLVPPLLILALHWLCILITAADRKNEEQNHKVFGLIFWICPIISCLTSGLMYAVALGKTFDISVFLPLLLGLMFVIIGNYLPKCKQNYTIGIKVKWALANEENWNATHRFGGKVWVIGGLLLLGGIFLPDAAMIWVLLAGIIGLAAVPTLYSWLYYKKQVAAGSAPAKAVVPMSRAGKVTTAVVLAVTAVLLVILLIVAFSGDFEIVYGETAFTVDASGWSDVTVAYADIDAIEYRDRCTAGSRTFGYGTPSLLMGTFENEEFGSYTRFSRPPCESAVILSVDGKILVLGGGDDAETREIYETVLGKMEE